LPFAIPKPETGAFGQAVAGVSIRQAYELLAQNQYKSSRELFELCFDEKEKMKCRDRPWLHSRSTRLLIDGAETTFMLKPSTTVKGAAAVPLG